MMDGIFYTSVKGGGLAGAQEAHNHCAGAGDPISLLPIGGVYPTFIVILFIFNLRATTILATQI
jgi:hypothetical protein